LDRCQQIHTVGLETDLIDVSEQTLRAIVEGSIDVVSVHLPAMTRSTYESIMGIDSIVQVIENIKKLILIRQSRGKGTPIIVPTFTKLSSNLAEMEQWYDTWLGAVGSAVIVGPSDYAGKMPDLSVAQMAPPLRKPCRRIESRLTVWSDGSISMCEQDAFSQFSIGKIGETSLESVWKTRLKGIRDSHRCGSGLPVLCQSCQEWHRP
jgi:radical SAM protein with 4Fe4S-binding SPASM domain